MPLNTHNCNARIPTVVSHAFNSTLFTVTYNMVVKFVSNFYHF